MPPVQTVRIRPVSKLAVPASATVRVVSGVTHAWLRRLAAQRATPRSRPATMLRPRKRAKWERPHGEFERREFKELYREG